MKNQFLPIFLTAVTLLAACKKSEQEAPVPSDPYSDNSTSYETAFQLNGASTVDRKDGRLRLLMFKSLDSTAKLPNANNVAIVETTLSNLYSNSGSPFGNSGLNNSGLSLKDITAKSTNDPASVRATMEDYFTTLADASAIAVNNFNNNALYKDTAKVGVAGRLYVPGSISKYLVDEKGIEYAQVISKSFIGSLQLDYICNVLLSDNSLTNANNTTLINGKYTALQHRWYEAYGLLTLKDRYVQDANATTNGGESFLGSYVWEYNKEGYPMIPVAFLKGRKAAVDNNRTEAKVQAQFIRRELEKAVAMSAIGYLVKYKTGTSDAQRAHAIGEGLGFIYSTRFCNYHGADAPFSQNIMDNLIFNAANGFWSLSNAKADAAISALQAKFGL